MLFGASLCCFMNPLLYWKCKIEKETHSLHIKCKKFSNGLEFQNFWWVAMCTLVCTGGGCKWVSESFTRFAQFNPLWMSPHRVGQSVCTNWNQNIKRQQFPNNSVLGIWAWRQKYLTRYWKPSQWNWIYSVESGAFLNLFKPFLFVEAKDGYLQSGGQTNR